MSDTSTKPRGVDPMLCKTANEDNDFRIRSFNRENIAFFLPGVTTSSDRPWNEQPFYAEGGTGTFLK